MFLVSLLSEGRENCMFEFHGGEPGNAGFTRIVRDKTQLVRLGEKMLWVSP
jgi:hypothetical protein